DAGERGAAGRDVDGRTEASTTVGGDEQAGRHGVAIRVGLPERQSDESSRPKLVPTMISLGLSLGKSSWNESGKAPSPRALPPRKTVQTRANEPTMRLWGAMPSFYMVGADRRRDTPTSIPVTIMQGATRAHGASAPAPWPTHARSRGPHRSPAI